MAKKIKEASQNVDSLISQLRWGESYTSLLLGLAVVILASILIVSFTRHKTVSSPKKTTLDVSTIKTQIDQAKKKEETQQQKGMQIQQNGEATYTVSSGENLWNIAEKTYNSGYNWVDIAKENNLQNPDVIAVGVTLKLPKAETRKPMVTMDASPPDVQNASTSKITSSSYTVKNGDYLWNIALRAYGDGYKWVDIAKANKLANPDLIYAGNTFTIPR